MKEINIQLVSKQGKYVALLIEDPENVTQEKLYEIYTKALSVYKELYEKNK